MNRHLRVVLAGLLVALPGLVTAAAMPASAGSVGPSFGPQIVLSGKVGGEPSLQDDGHGNVYVASPTGLASALVNATGVLVVSPATGGGALWRSLDGGQSFVNAAAPTFFGTLNGGGDTDVTADVKGKVYTADLEAADTDIQHSTDHGATFSQPPDHAGPSDDREWLTPIGDKLFLTYHELTTNLDLIFVSSDGGTTFLPAGLAGKIVDPTENPTAASDCAQNNLISKPVTDSRGGIYIVLNCSTFPSNLLPTGAPLNRLYVATSRDGGKTFKTTLASDVGGTGGGTWGHVFNQLGIDNGGNLYIVASGNLKSVDPVQTFLIRSLDNGTTWKAPINLNTAAGAPLPTHASVFPAIATGQAGEVAAGYYQVEKCQLTAVTCKVDDYRNDGVVFQFFITQTFNANLDTPTFATSQVTTTSPHQNGICTDGLFCGVPGFSSGGNRNLADFESMAVDPTGHIELVIPEDAGNVTAADSSTNKAGTDNWFFKQTSGPLMVPGPTNGNGTGNQTYVAGAFTSPPSPSPSQSPVAAAAAPSPLPSVLPNTSAALAGGSVDLPLAVLAGLFLLGAVPVYRRLRG